MTLGVFFTDINVGACTFVNERGMLLAISMQKLEQIPNRWLSLSLSFVAVFWRDASVGMTTLPYYLAKVQADIPRIVVACNNVDRLSSVPHP